MNRLVLHFVRTLAILIVPLLLGAPAVAQQTLDIVAPSDGGVPIIDGNSWLAPFSTGENRSSRFQQLYDASLFSGLAAGGGWVYSILYRGDPFLTRSFGIAIPRIQLNLSTVTRSESELSGSFDENTGPDDAVALGPRSLTFAIVGGNGQSGFAGFNLNHPFFYDPDQGNLLLDYRVYQGGPAVPLFLGGDRLDAFDRLGDGVSSVFAYGQGLPTSGDVTSLGLATLFIIAPMPKITISLQSSNVLLRYAYRPPGFILQQSAVLGSGASWQPVIGPAITNGAEKVVTLPLDVATRARFFRLVLPYPLQGSTAPGTGVETILIPNQYP